LASRYSLIASGSLVPAIPYTLHAGVVLAFSYGEVGRTTEAIELGERVLADCERILDQNHFATLRARAGLARCYRAVGRNLEAIELGKRVLADSEAILGREHRNTLLARELVAAVTKEISC
jgi:tetratricopeptide (TPR) repeat protein